MLLEICGYTHNYFMGTIKQGTFEIINGTIAIDFLKEGQRFRVYGSSLNDGVYTWHSDGIYDDDETEAAELRDETFTGAIVGMDVPIDVLKLNAEITEWVKKYGDTINSPFNSENVIGVYSYSKVEKSKNYSSNPNVSWQDIFGARLKAYMKVST